MKVYKFAVVLFMVGLALSACSTPAPTATDTVAPTAAVTESATAAPTATASLQPSVTATQLGPQLEVVEWVRWNTLPAFDEDIPETNIDFLVRNPYDFPVYVYQPAVRLINSAGEIVYRTREVSLAIFFDAGWNRILPGETVPARVCACLGRGVTEISEWDTFDLSVLLKEADPIAYTTDLQISMGDFRQTDEYFFTAQGLVTNTSDQPLRMILLRAVARDANGHYVGHGLIGVRGDISEGKFESLEPGSSYEFPISVYLDPLLAGEALEFEVTGFGVVAEE